MTEKTPYGQSTYVAKTQLENDSCAIAYPLVLNQGQDAVAVTEVNIAAGNVLQGSSDTDAGSLITIPAGGTWKGTITLAASVAGGLTAVTATPAVTVQGTGATPPSGSVVAQLALYVPALLAVTVGASAAVTSGTLTVVAGASNSCTLQLNFNNAHIAAAQANGYLM